MVAICDYPSKVAIIVKNQQGGKITFTPDEFKAMAKFVFGEGDVLRMDSVDISSLKIEKRDAVRFQQGKSYLIMLLSSFERMINMREYVLSLCSNLEQSTHIVDGVIARFSEQLTSLDDINSARFKIARVLSGTCAIEEEIFATHLEKVLNLVRLNDKKSEDVKKEGNI